MQPKGLNHETKINSPFSPYHFVVGLVWPGPDASAAITATKRTNSGPEIRRIHGLFVASPIIQSTAKVSVNSNVTAGNGGIESVALFSADNFFLE